MHVEGGGGGLFYLIVDWRRGSRSYTMDSMCAVSVRATTSWKYVGWKSEEFKASESHLLWKIVLYYHNSNLEIMRMNFAITCSQ